MMRPTDDDELLKSDRDVDIGGDVLLGANDSRGGLRHRLMCDGGGDNGGQRGHACFLSGVPIRCIKNRGRGCCDDG